MFVKISFIGLIVGFFTQIEVTNLTQLPPEKLRPVKMVGGRAELCVLDLHIVMTACDS